jgi:hypothetical protein
VQADGEEKRPERDRRDRVEERLAGVEKTPYVVHELTIAEPMPGPVRPAGPLSPGFRVAR